MYLSTSIGTPPWQLNELVAALPEFMELHAARPVRDNRGGMGAPHLFASWFVARNLQPETIIESGVWKGQGTWILEQACPNAHLHCLDPQLEKREYVSKRATYSRADFCELDWTAQDGERTLVFFDDHQNAITRLMQCSWFGLRHAIFEDNHPAGEGDFYTLRQAFTAAGFGAVTPDERGRRYARMPARLARRLTAVAHRAFDVRQAGVIPQYVRTMASPNQFDRAFLERNLACYQEFPPVFAPAGESSTGWPHPLLAGAQRGTYPELYRSRASYNGLCYTRLSK